MRFNRGGRCAIALLTIAAAALAVNGTAAATPARTSASTAVSASPQVKATPAAAKAVPADTTFDGCRKGYVCIYDHDNQPPKASDHHTDYYKYGTYNFSNITGWHDVVNNQSGTAVADFCYGYNGTSCHWDEAGAGTYTTWVDYGRWEHIYFTPVDSMRLCKAWKDC